MEKRKEFDSAQDENAAIIFGKKLTGKKAIVAGSILGIVFGLVVVGVLAFFIL